MGYWEEQQLKQMGHMDQMMVSETKPDPKYGEPALEETLNNVKKTLWDVQRHTHDTQSRLDVNNKSGPTWWLKFQTKEYLELMADQLGGIEEYQMSINNVLENSAIARHSKSPLETSAEMVTEKKTGIGVLAGFLKEIAESNSLIAKALAGTAEDKLESTAAAAKAAKEEKKQTGIFGGMLEALKKTAVGSWLIDNWKMIAATLFVLFAPLKWIKKLWGWAKTFWDMPIWGKLLTVLGGLGLYFGSKAGIAKLFTMAKTSFAEKGMAGLKPGAGMTKALGVGAILAGVALAIKDGFAGAKLSEEWGVGKTAGVAGAVLGGTNKGIEGAMENFGKWGLIGAGIGTLIVPGLGTLVGGLIGGAIGALLGWIGGERIAKFFKASGEKFKEIWEGFTDGIGLMIDDFKVYLIDPIINIFKAMKNWATGMFKELAPNWLLKKLGIKVDRPIKDTGEYTEGPSPEEVQAQDEKKKKTNFNAWVKSHATDKTQSQRKSGLDALGGIKAAKAQWNKMKSSGGTTTAGTTTRTGKEGVIPGYGEGVTIQEYQRLERDRADAEEKATLSPKQKPKWNDVAISPGVSDKGMAGTEWSLLGGLKKIKDGILSVWNSEGIAGAPTFTSGRRSAKTNKASGGVKHSQHIAGSAFDLRNKEIPIDQRDSVFGKLQSSFGSGILGIRHKELDNTDAQHFHFQLAAKGFGGIVNKATGFIAGEEGPEMVNIIPLQSPNDKMNVMNAINAENQTLQGQSGSPTIINTTNAQATTTNQTGGVFTLPNPVAAPKLTTSLPS